MLVHGHTVGRIRLRSRRIRVRRERRVRIRRERLGARAGMPGIRLRMPRAGLGAGAGMPGIGMRAGLGAGLRMPRAGLRAGLRMPRAGLRPRTAVVAVSARVKRGRGIRVEAAMIAGAAVIAAGVETTVIAAGTEVTAGTTGPAGAALRCYAKGVLQVFERCSCGIRIRGFQGHGAGGQNYGQHYQYFFHQNFPPYLFSVEIS